MYLLYRRKGRGFKQVKMIKPTNNEELKEMIVDGVINCNYEDLICDFDIYVEASIINAGDIHAVNITCKNIDAENITTGDIIARGISADDIIAQDINARDINAADIDAKNINAWDINAWDINARDISYYAVCFAYENIVCSSIQGIRQNSQHFCLDGEITIRKEVSNK